MTTPHQARNALAEIERDYPKSAKILRDYIQALEPMLFRAIDLTKTRDCALLLAENIPTLHKEIYDTLDYHGDRG